MSELTAEEALERLKASMDCLCLNLDGSSAGTCAACQSLKILSDQLERLQARVTELEEWWEDLCLK